LLHSAGKITGVDEAEIQFTERSRLENVPTWKMSVIWVAVSRREMRVTLAD
jgi:hypothetical protein